MVLLRAWVLNTFNAPFSDNFAIRDREHALKYENTSIKKENKIHDEIFNNDSLMQIIQQIENPSKWKNLKN